MLHPYFTSSKLLRPLILMFSLNLRQFSAVSRAEIQDGVGISCGQEIPVMSRRCQAGPGHEQKLSSDVKNLRTNQEKWLSSDVHSTAQSPTAVWQI